MSTCATCNKLRKVVNSALTAAGLKYKFPVVGDNRNKDLTFQKPNIEDKK